MKYTLSSLAPESLKTDCWIIPLFQDETPKVSGKIEQIISEQLKLGNISADLAQTSWVFNPPHCSAKRILLLGFGKRGSLTSLQAIAALRTGIREALAKKSTTALLALNSTSWPFASKAQTIEQITLAFSHTLYRFSAFKTDPPPRVISLKSLQFSVDKKEEKELKPALDRAVALSQGLDFVKDLANLPSNHCTPSTIAKSAVDLGKEYKSVKTTVLSIPEMKKLGMGGMLAVGQGSRQEPKFVIAHYEGAAKSHAPVALVGKGITFDSGGISLKPPTSMEEMKFDMCGAVTVLAAVKVAALLKLPLNIVAIAACAENMPGGNAIKPGDIITTLSGTTVEVINTDAEGRLVLSDALTYCARYKPKAIIDVATLTGSMLMALGLETSGFFSNDEDLAKSLTHSADQSLDEAWRMPLLEGYLADFKSGFADLANVAPHRWGGAIQAAVFLEHFVKETPWAHFDIAGTAWLRSGPEKGATGRPLGLLMHYLYEASQAK